MGDEIRQGNDEELSGLLRSERPAPTLPPGFQNRVWQRIERGEQFDSGILERIAGWLLSPRLAAAGLVVAVLLAAGAGAARGVRVGEREARNRYVASVDPSFSPR